MSSALELEIKALLDELGQPAAVAERLIPYVEGSEDTMTPENTVVLARFLLHSGLYAQLLDFVIRHLNVPGFKTPWPYVMEAIALSRPLIDDVLADVIMEGIAEDGATADAARSRALDLHTPSLKAERADRRLRVIKAHRAEKEKLFEQLITLRTQQLYEQEKRLLQRLQRLYPDDAEVLREARNHRERYALEVLAKHSRLSKGPSFEQAPPDAESEDRKRALAESLRERAAAEPENAADLAVAAAVLEMWETALDVLQSAPGGTGDWLRLELLLGARRYLELLNELARVEQKNSRDPETFFATAYLRAQALWGLGQKHQAIEVLESLLAARPQYRSAPSLLALWRSA